MPITGFPRDSDTVIHPPYMKSPTNDMEILYQTMGSGGGYRSARTETVSKDDQSLGPNAPYIYIHAYIFIYTYVYIYIYIYTQDWTKVASSSHPHVFLPDLHMNLDQI